MKAQMSSYSWTLIYWVGQSAVNYENVAGQGDLG